VSQPPRSKRSFDDPAFRVPPSVDGARRGREFLGRQVLAILAQNFFTVRNGMASHHIRLCAIEPRSRRFIRESVGWLERRIGPGLSQACIGPRHGHQTVLDGERHCFQT
jgi:hypothetical protein